MINYRLSTKSNPRFKNESIRRLGDCGASRTACFLLATLLWLGTGSSSYARDSAASIAAPASARTADITLAATDIQPDNKPDVDAQPTKGKNGEFLGIQEGFPGDLKKYDGIVEGIHSFGVEWVRMYWNWSWVEGSRGKRYLVPIKIAVDAAHRRGMKIIVLATGAPAWANGGKAQDYPPTDANIQDFAAYTAAIASETGADAIEIWNEPNAAGFWASGPDPMKMAHLQIAAYSAIKAVRPQTIVITGGLTEVYLAPQTFFKNMIAADPQFIKSFDAVGLHPYNEPTDPLLPGSSGMKNVMTVQTPAIHQMLVENGRGNVPIWFTEYGVATYGQYSVDEAAQAVYLSHFFQGLVDLRRQGINIGVSIIYMLKDWSAYQGKSDQPFFGLLHHDGSEKPAAAVVRDYAAAKYASTGIEP
jgi:hypothetical protein